jgi:outer membrane protein OmpA-like peptidoglycan-associated protein
MNAKFSRVVMTVGLMGMSAAALAGEPEAVKPRPPQEPVGFISGAVIGGFAAGPIGAIVGAGVGTWLGNRVHRASEAKKAEAQLAALQGDNSALDGERAALLTEKTQWAAEKSQLTESNQTLSAELLDLSRKVESVTTDESGASGVLDGLQGDVLFRTGSAEITPELAHQVQVLASAVAKSPALRVRIDGYADPRGSDDRNLALSQQRADAVRDLLVAAGVPEEALEVNAYGKTQSTATDVDGYALERRVRLTLQAEAGVAVAQVGQNE